VGGLRASSLVASPRYHVPYTRHYVPSQLGRRASTVLHDYAIFTPGGSRVGDHVVVEERKKQGCGTATALFPLFRHGLQAGRRSRFGLVLHW
jgi:hypothetical protein